MKRTALPGAAACASASGAAARGAAAGEASGIAFEAAIGWWCWEGGSSSETLLLFGSGASSSTISMGGAPLPKPEIVVPRYEPPVPAEGAEAAPEAPPAESAAPELSAEARSSKLQVASS